MLLVVQRDLTTSLYLPSDKLPEKEFLYIYLKKEGSKITYKVFMRYEEGYRIVSDEKLDENSFLHHQVRHYLNVIKGMTVEGEIKISRVIRWS